MKYIPGFTFVVKQQYLNNFQFEKEYTLFNIKVEDNNNIYTFKSKDKTFDKKFKNISSAEDFILSISTNNNILLNEAVLKEEFLKEKNIHKKGIIVYLPPEKFEKTVEIFLDNLNDFPSFYPIYYISDFKYPNAINIPNPTLYFKNKDQISAFVFLHALKLAEEIDLEQFIYLETDCRVCVKNWDILIFENFTDKTLVAGGNLAISGLYKSSQQFQKKIKELNAVNIENSYTESKVLIQSPHNELPCVFVNGAPAIYNTKPLRTILGDTSIIPTVQTKHRIQDLYIGECAAKYYGDECINKFKHLPLIMATAGETIYTFNTRKNALESKKCVAVHPIKSRWKPMEKEYSFYHSGDFGDIIYALKAVELIGGGNLILGNEYRGLYPPRSGITNKSFDLLVPLLNKQHYLRSITYTDKYIKCSYDLNQFRDFWSGRHTHNLNIETLVETNCYNLGIQDLFDNKPWLITEKKPLTPIIIHRSGRYQEKQFPWKEILNKFNNHITFVGMEEEHKEFQQEFGSVVFYKVKDFNEMAEIINGAKWFIGNQSFPNSIALGLGKNVYQEANYSFTPDCLFKRNNFFTQADSLDVIQI